MSKLNAQRMSGLGMVLPSRHRHISGDRVILKKWLADITGVATILVVTDLALINRNIKRSAESLPVDFFITRYLIKQASTPNSSGSSVFGRIRGEKAIGIADLLVVQPDIESDLKALSESEA